MEKYICYLLNQLIMNWIVNLENQVHVRGRETAVVHDGTAYTYNELNGHSNSFANWLKSFGGKRVCMYVPNTYEVYIAAFGAMKAGGAPAPINYMFGRNTVAYVLEDADADVVMTFPDDAEMVASAAADAGVDHIVTIGDSEHGTITIEEILDAHSDYTETVPQRDDDLFGLMYTSGTTGDPKGVYKSHRSVCVHTKAMRHVWKITSDQTWLCAGPLYHTSGFESSSLPVLAAGGTVVLHTWDIDHFLSEVETYQPDSAYIAGSMLLDMLEYEHSDKYDVSSLKQVFAGGAPMDPEDYDTVEEMYDVRISERLGMTEAGIILTYPVGTPGRFSPRDEVPGRVPGSCGKAVVQEVDVRVVDLSTKDVVDVGEGEMQIRGDTLFEKYLNKPEKTERAFTDDGWYRTGDVVRIDENGYVFHLRRADSMIVTGGENVYPRGVERVINNHPSVKESAVFPIPDAHWGERVCAAVVLKTPDVTEEELIRYCKGSDNISDFEAPKQIFFRDSLPKTPTKSVRRPDLTEEYKDAPFPQ